MKYIFVGTNVLVPQTGQGSQKVLTHCLVREKSEWPDFKNRCQMSASCIFGLFAYIVTLTLLFSWTLAETCTFRRPCLFIWWHPSWRDIVLTWPSEPKKETLQSWEKRLQTCVVWPHPEWFISPSNHQHGERPHLFILLRSTRWKTLYSAPRVERGGGLVDFGSFCFI